MKRRSWVAIAFGMAFVLVVLGVIGLGVGAYVFFQHVGIHAMPPEAAAREMARERTRFTGQEPLFRVEAGEVTLNDDGRRAAAPPGTTLTSIRVLTFDPDEDRLVRIDVPFWLFKIRGSTAGFDLDGVLEGGDLEVTPEELERLGPTLLLDHEEPDGTRVLVWTE